MYVYRLTRSLHLPFAVALPRGFLLQLQSVALLLLPLFAAMAFALPVASVPDVAAAPDVIATVTPAFEPLAALHAGERFPVGAHLVRIHQGRATTLFPGFAATADAQVSFDGQSVLFAARPRTEDPWQIWEAPLATGQPRLLYASGKNAICPFYLPNGQFLFALQTADGFQLEVAGKDLQDHLAPIPADAAAASLQQISHLPVSFIPSAILPDGRILFEAFEPLGAGSTPELFLVYTDGSGLESFRCDHGQPRWGGRVLSSGDVVFTHGRTLGRFTSPLAHEAPVATASGGFAAGPVEILPEVWLFARRAAAAERYTLALGKAAPTATTARMATFSRYFSDPANNVVQPVLVAAQRRPKHHPSALHSWNYANQLALDARLGRAGDLDQLPAHVAVEIRRSSGASSNGTAANGTAANGNTERLGQAPIASDGSFFVQIPADQPIRMLLLDAKGNVLRREQGWRWAARGEQRICVGCHTGPERASENRVPQVLLNSTTAADLTGAEKASSINRSGAPAAALQEGR